MPDNPLPRGAVVRRDSRSWVVWNDPIALPLDPQTGPRHRSHVRLDFGGRAVLVRCLDPVLLREGYQVVGQCDPDIVARIATTIQRAIDAAAIERRFMPHEIKFSVRPDA